jgi:glycine C-acetyltransferase/8-amino-7-oxononanoate synthase
MPLMQSAPGAVTKIDGREFFYFVGTGYLGLQSHPEIIRAACEAAQQYGSGSANSRTAFGTTPPLVEVEQAASRFFGHDDAFYFASGWMGNAILIEQLGPQFGPVFVDECAHYSLCEAAKLVRCSEGNSVIKFHHRNADDLQDKLRHHLKPGECPLVLSDGIFAATGKIAPVDIYSKMLERYPGSAILLDDAHAFAVLGENGRGTFEHFGLWSRVNQQWPGISGQWPVASGQCTISPRPQAGEGPGMRAVGTTSAPPITIDDPSSSLSTIHHPPSTSASPALLCSGTFSKAFGGFGGILSGSREFIAQLKSHSPSMGGASPPPAMIAAATARAIELVRTTPALRTRLQANVRQLKTGLSALGYEVDDTPTPIVCLTIGDAENMRRIQQELMARGIVIAYMTAYSGLGPEGGLRLAVFATHTEAMIARLLDELRALS